MERDPAVGVPRWRFDRQDHDISTCGYSIMWWRGIEQRCREIKNIAVAGRRAALGRRSQLLNQLLAAVVIAKVANELIRLQIRPN